MNPKKKILFLTRYSRMGASSRLRTYQYLPLFEQAGYTCTIRPLFNDRYLSELYSGKGVSFINVFFCYFNRFLLLFALRDYERIFIEKELFPFFPSWAEYWISRTGTGYIVDYDDAVFHNYDLHRSLWVRLLYKNKIKRVMRHSEKVLAGNAYLADMAKKAGAPKIILLPTVVDSLKYHIGDFQVKDCPVKIGWIGSPTTLKYLRKLLSVLEKVNKTNPFELVIIGGGKPIGFSGKETLIEWSEEREVGEIQKLDIGIMPLTDNNWEKGKCGYKLIQYMACGLPVLASPVGVNQELVCPGMNGFLPNHDKEWVECLGQLILDRGLRRKMGRKGYKLVMENYTLQTAFPVYFKAIS